jgi:hypothetical protein
MQPAQRSRPTALIEAQTLVACVGVSQEGLTRRIVPSSRGRIVDTNRYESARKRSPKQNPVVLGARATAWVFWIGVALAAVLFSGAMIWLLTHAPL